MSICALALAAPAAAGPSPNVPKLLRAASKASGLRVKSQPKVTFLSPGAMQTQALRLLDREYTPDQQAYDETVSRALGLLSSDEALRPSLVARAASATGLYDPQLHTIYVRKQALKAERRALLVQLVYALQDQNFNLRRLSGLRTGRRDLSLAGGAPVDAYARSRAYVANKRKLAAAAAPMNDFLSLEAGFSATTGMRFVAQLLAVGGRHAMFTALRSFPTTTEQVFHVDAFLEHQPALTITLPTAVGRFGREREDTFGELDVRALLAAFKVPQRDRVATGWGGGKTALYRDPNGRQAVALALDWDEPADADQWSAAVATYVDRAFGAGAAATTSCPATTCWSVGGHDLAFTRSGTRTVLVLAPDVAGAATLATGILN
jgi:hypothetical protein